MAVPTHSKSSSRTGTFSRIHIPRLRRDVLVSILTTFVILIYVELLHSSSIGNTLIRTYDPAENQAKLTSRLRTKCTVSMPTNDTITENREWGVRLISYHNIHLYLRTRWASKPSAKLKVLGKERFLTPYEEILDIHKESVDLHHIPYATNTFDVIAADQVLEHVIFPQLVMVELHRVLKPGGIAILTTIAYNPLHEGGQWHDYWRYMLDGMLTLSLPFRNVPLCGSWGNANAIASRAGLGLGSDTKSASFEENMRVNELNNPFVVWMIVEK